MLYGLLVLIFRLSLHISFSETHCDIDKGCLTFIRDPFSHIYPYFKINMKYKHMAYKHAVIHIWLIISLFQNTSSPRVHCSLLYLLSPDPTSKVKVFCSPQTQHVSPF